MPASSSCARKNASGWLQRTALPILLIFFWPVSARAQFIRGQLNLKALFAAAGRMHNIDPDLLEAIAEVESGGDPLSVSPKGALGLMQLMPATASAFSVFDPFNPIDNVRGAADFIDYLRTRLGGNLNLQGLPVLLAAYNAGPGAVERYGGVPPYAETHQYVQRVIERYANHLSTQAAIAPVLILGPQPYVIRLGPGAGAMQPEPVVINVDRNDSAAHQVAFRDMPGYFVVARGTGTAPWIRRAVFQRSELARPRNIQLREQPSSHR